MMLLLMSFLMLMMFVYVNTLFYSMALLLMVLGLLYVLVSNIMLNSLTMLLLIIVYVGAMMILIGYICAICPNLILSPKHLSSYVYIIYTLIVSFLFLEESNSTSLDLFVPMSNYFYSSYGIVVFVVLVFMLFITLLMVTSQYMTPKGPFRSVVI